MTEYPGPWIQAPDYERADDEVFLPESIPTDAHRELAEETSPTFNPYDPGDFLTPIMTSHAAAREVIDGDGAQAGAMRVETHYSVAGPPFVNVRSGDVFRSWRVSTISPENLGVRYWAPTPFVGITPPPDAIGWEWQDPEWTPGDSAKSQVIALNADLEVGLGPVNDFAAGNRTDPFVTAVEVSSGHFLSDDGELGVTDTDQLQAWDGPGGSLVDMSDAEATPGLITLVAGPHYPVPVGDDDGNLHFPYDLTPFLDERGRIVLSSYVTFDTAHPEAGATPIVPSNIAADSGSVAYGHHNLIWHPVWTLRPPIFRWLYATPQITSAPPLRHTQRDDRHGPSPRNRPARSRQAGRRNTGYL